MSVIKCLRYRGSCLFHVLKASLLTMEMPLSLGGRGSYLLVFAVSDLDLDHVLTSTLTNFVKHLHSLFHLDNNATAGETFGEKEREKEREPELRCRDAHKQVKRGFKLL